MFLKVFWFYFVFIYFATFILVNAETIYKTVETKDGAVRGVLNVTLFHQKPFYLFKGIPFAKPPIGELRFKPPKPVESWKPNTIDAFKYHPPCSQFGFTSEHYPILSNDTLSSEDCLYLNIFVPVVNKTDKLPVMLYIFGGEFIAGSPNEYEPDFMVERDIIFVFLNYRVGMFGFMSLGTAEYSGNMGLKDQQLGIKWTYSNIEYFGGNKHQITLAGHSSGSYSVTHHILNEESRKYFTQSIAMSGVATIWNGYVEGDHRCLVEKFAKSFNRSIDTESLIEFLQNVSANEIIKYSLEVHRAVSYEYVWFPTIEVSNAIQPFLTENPNEKLDNLCCVNITSYFTVTNREAVALPSAFIDPNFIAHPRNGFYVNPPIHGYDKSIGKKPYLKELMNEFYNFFFADLTDEFEREDQRIIIESDFRFSYFIDKWVEKHVQISRKNTYYHEFSVDAVLKNIESVKPGAGHADDLCYILWCYRFSSLYKNIFEAKDTANLIAYNTIDDLVTLFSNFVKYGKPAVDAIPLNGFKPVELNQISILNILNKTNGGFIFEKSRSGRRTQFYDYFVAETKRLVEAHGDAPKRTENEQFCERIFKERNEA